MRIYPSGKQAQLIDKYTQEVIGIPGLVLMEKAAETLADEIVSAVISTNNDSSCERINQKLYGFRKDRDRILAIVESGNNGGDAVAAARILKTQGYDTYIYEINGISSKSDSYMKQIEIARNTGVKFIDLSDALEEDNKNIPETERNLPEVSIKDFRIIIDGIFGVGLSRDLKGIHEKVVGIINEASDESDIFVVGTDIPSGISSTSGHILGAAVKCDLTVTFQYIKYGMLIDEGRTFSGKITCRDIGLYKAGTLEAMRQVLSYYYADVDGDDSQQNVKAGANNELTAEKIVYEFDDEDVNSRIPPRNDDSNKGTYGKVLILAGSKDVYGALYLSAEACYRTGVGLVKVVTDIRNRDVLADKLPEAMMLTYDSADAIKLNDYKSAIKWADVILAGPGLGTAEISKKLLQILIDECKSGQQIILDADALNIIAQEDAGKTLKKLTSKLGYEQVIITPHIMEMLRLRESLTDISSLDAEMMKAGYDSEYKKTSYIKARAPEMAKLFSDIYGVVCILKDARTTVSCTGYLSDKKEYPVYLNTTGNNGMSTGGSGDVLAGIIAGLLAQNRDERLTNYETSCLAVSIHGRAGDIAGSRKGEYSLIAGDIIDGLPEILKK